MDIERIERVNPLDLDLDTADEIANLTNLSNRADGVRLPERSGPAALKFLQLQSDGSPVDALWLARTPDGRLVGSANMALPHRENTDTARLRGMVHPEARGQGVGRALLEATLALAAESRRVKVYTGAFEGTAGEPALTAMGFTALGSVDVVRRLDLHTVPGDRWQQLYDEAREHAADYELVHLVGQTPPELIEDLVVLHAAINDAPLDDPDMEGDAWDADRLTAYDNAMAARSETVYRVLARHRTSGEWAGMSMLCVDEFSPSIAFQEDTSVVRKHRGHRLGLLMKADMLRWLSADRPEVGATDTWNAATNHHMIAVNERLGATVVARYSNHRMDLG